MKIRPAREVLDIWMDIYLPDRDLFFIDQEDLGRIPDQVLEDVLVIEIDRFYQHPNYRVPNYTNSYEYWNIKGASHVIVARSHWIEVLDRQWASYILKRQVELNRGLVLLKSFLEDQEDFPEDYIVGDYLILQKNMWEKLARRQKEALIINMLYSWWDDGQALEVPGLESHLASYANSYSVIQGVNCLATALYSISGGKEFYMEEWVFEDVFLRDLSYYSYERSEEKELKAKDLVVFFDSQGRLVHASYYIGEEVFFNKQGQTIFNPVKLISKDRLLSSWKDYDWVIYRKKEII